MNNDFPRRSFLRTGALGVAGLMAPGTVLLEPQSLGSTKAVAPSDRVRFGMIGIGMQGSGLLPNAISLPGVECVAAADLYDDRHTLAKQITNNSSLPTTRKYQELLDRKDIDCIVAAVPDHWHKRVVVDACNAGKDIYCEKPMSHKRPKDSKWWRRRRKIIASCRSVRSASAPCCARRLVSCIMRAQSATSKWWN